jgi:DNA modification methylase
LRLIDGKKADMVFTDPPYGVDYSGGIQFTKNGVKTGQREKLIADNSEDIYAGSIPMMAMFCDGPIYTWFAGTKAKTIYTEIEKVGDIHSLIIWEKNGGYGAMNSNYKQKHEPCLYWKAKGKKLNFCGPTTETTIWKIDKDGKNNLHPTQKPVELSLKAIKNHSVGLILDLFLGSGSTLIGCEKLNRNCYGMELDPKYCDVIVQRYVDYTGNENIKLNGKDIIWKKTPTKAPIKG